MWVKNMVYEVGSRIKELRDACKWSQKDLGDRINKSVATVSSYELNIGNTPMPARIRRFERKKQRLSHTPK